jgi:hypothetical protein
VAARAVGETSASAAVFWFVLVAVLAVVAAVLGVSTGDHTAAAAWAWTAAGLGEVGVAMVAAGVRQWRFAPWPRRRGFVTVVGATGVLLGVGAPLVVHGSGWGIVTFGVTMAVVGIVASAPARLLHRAQRAQAHQRDGMGAR